MNDKDAVKDIKAVLKLYHGAKSHKTPRRVQDLLTALGLINADPYTYEVAGCPDDGASNWKEAGGDTVCHSVVFPFELVRELADVLEKPGAAKQLKKLSKSQLQAIAKMVEVEGVLGPGYMTLRPPPPPTKTDDKNKNQGKNGNATAKAPTNQNEDDDEAYDSELDDEYDEDEDGDYDEDDDEDGNYNFSARADGWRAREVLNGLYAAAPATADPKLDIAAAAYEAVQTTTAARTHKRRLMDEMLFSVMMSGMLMGFGPAPKRARGF